MKSIPQKQKAQIQGVALEYVKSGAGAPPIILVNGSGGPIEGWYKVYAELETLSTVFAYNRPGIGGSESSKFPQSGDVIVATLRELLAAVGLIPPYLLVGHSLGGLYVNLYARQFPHEVAGAVFLDAAAPGDEVLQNNYQTPLQSILNKISGLFKSSKDTHAEVQFVHETVKQIRDTEPFPDIPLVVISGGKGIPRMLMTEKARQIRAENQKALAALSSRGEHVIAAQSGHFPQFAEPELVVNTIRQMLERL
ncbi:MAG: alpha/beta hydrolase [Anaerolineae bacterium]|nr:alpha/beta hydrolase [Anaerolineae bacterium]